MIQNARQIIKKFLQSNRGATAIEYALIAALISAFVITAILVLGNGYERLYNGIANVVVDAVSNI